MVTRVREKGQVTIPANIREALHLTKNSLVSIARVGNGILLIPKASVYESVASKFSAKAEKEGITLQNLLTDLKKDRRKKSS